MRPLLPVRSVLQQQIKA